MTRSSKALPKHCHHKATGQGYVRFRGSSKPFYTGRWGTAESAAEYDRLIQLYLANGRQPPVKKADGTYLIRDLAADYWRAFIESHPNSREPEDLKYTLKTFLALFGDRKVDELSSLHLLQTRDVMIENGLARTLINRRITKLKRLFKWGASRQLFPTGELLAIQAIEGLRYGQSAAKEIRPIEAVPREHVAAVMPLVSKPVAAMIELQLRTGMRPGEVLIMRHMDIDRSDDLWIYRPFQHKNKHRRMERTIYLGPHCQSVLRPFLLRPEPAYLFSPKEAEAERRRAQGEARKSKETPSQLERHVRRSRSPRSKLRDHYDVAGYRRAIAKACTTAEIPRWSPNQLRHLAATEIRQKYGLDAAQVILGHTTARTTEIYAEVNQRRARDIMSEIG